MPDQLVQRIFACFVGISGAFCVLFGAWLAHAGEHLQADILVRLETAHLYQVIHTLALLAITVWCRTQPSKVLVFAQSLMLIGIAFFSVSLYLKTLFAMPVIGKLAPLGGISLALAWLSLIFVGNKK
ncbi:DUF423 domain-containing protein [Thalassotalea euphylliae]|uniref:DUF423 domain-containing protein n=1 Tax=Thalassotalea euphylliae TaxID=1655234 RepID=UPI003630502F